jgi:hypothetical protein
LDDVESDLKKMKVKEWKEKMRNREQWRLVIEGAKAHPGMQRRLAGRQAGIKRSESHTILGTILTFTWMN